jgi:hypothetical protein
VLVPGDRVSVAVVNEVLTFATAGGQAVEAEPVP